MDKKKISTVEIILMFMIAGGAYAFDAVTALTAFVPVIGQVLVFMNIFVDFIVFAIIEFWLIMKGGMGVKKQAGAFVGNLLSAIPVLDIFPFRLVGLGASIYMINHSDSKLASVVGNVKSVKSGAKNAEIASTVSESPEQTELAKVA